MQAKKPSAPIALFAAVAALAVLTAGCIGQDREQEVTFTVAADAGGAVVEVGDAAHLEWSEHQAVEVEEGGHLAEAPEIEWQASTGAHAAEANFSFTPTVEGLVLVELTVTAENHSASDVGGVLALPSGAGARRIYLGIVGDAQLGNVPGLLQHLSTTFGEHRGHYYSSSAAADVPAFTLVPQNNGSTVALIIAVAQANGSLTTLITAPISLDGALQYTLYIDAKAGAAHRLEGRGGIIDQDIDLAERAAGRSGEGQVRVLVAPAQQTLPGFEASAAAVVFPGLALIAARRRR